MTTAITAPWLTVQQCLPGLAQIEMSLDLTVEVCLLELAGRPVNATPASAAAAGPS